MTDTQTDFDMLLDALQRAYDHVVKDAPSWFEDGSFEQKAMQREADRVRDALAKARGDA